MKDAASGRRRRFSLVRTSGTRIEQGLTARDRFYRIRHGVTARLLGTYPDAPARIAAKTASSSAYEVRMSITMMLRVCIAAVIGLVAYAQAGVFAGFIAMLGATLGVALLALAMFLSGSRK